MIDQLNARLAQLGAPSLHLHALVDGLQYQEHVTGETLGAQPGALALLHGTADGALADAGPWLIDPKTASAGLVKQIEQLEFAAHAVTWIITPLDIESLGAALRQRLDVHLPDGRTAMLRFWDPRVLATIAQDMDDDQRRQFFGDIVEWHLLLNGRRVHIGRHHADTH
ncbi:DUF4123 domain-containing protein [Herbaspirillum sp. YR522]|uniref:DUF4123 domain-containing protein n=1 Tax=Herbaspirillum sp. YR522 TaxID=1144342 RepID=UPI00026F5CB4|nr:DUF4123 domain-containing protein [Herbaspirillum sp. YR522]EJN01737.1 hypothetical protein PMI40_03224 [Herbaspirillum sp. YR522]